VRLLASCDIVSSRFFSVRCYGAHRDLHSFPTRRSSDLEHTGASLETVRMFCATARACDLVPLVRVPATEYHLLAGALDVGPMGLDRKSTRLNSSHDQISYAVFCLKKKKRNHKQMLSRWH